jgi:hypothetical protein
LKRSKRRRLMKSRWKRLKKRKRQKKSWSESSFLLGFLLGCLLELLGPVDLCPFLPKPTHNIDNQE